MLGLVLQKVNITLSNTAGLCTIFDAPPLPPPPLLPWLAPCALGRMLAKGCKVEAATAAAGSGTPGTCKGGDVVNGSDCASTTAVVVGACNGG